MPATLAPFATVAGAGVFGAVSSRNSGGGGFVAGYAIVSIFGSAVIRFFDAGGVLVDQTEVVTPSGLAACDRIFVGDDGFVAVWRGNEIHGGIVLARRGDALARVWRGPRGLKGVAAAPSLGGVLAWGPRDIFLVRADGNADRVPFALANDRAIDAVAAWGHDLVVTHVLAVDFDADPGAAAAAVAAAKTAGTYAHFACVRGDGATFLGGDGHRAIPVSHDMLIVWRGGEMVTFDSGAVERGHLPIAADAVTHDLLGRSRVPFLVVDGGDVISTNSAAGKVVRWDARTGAVRWQTPALTEKPWPLAPPMRVGRFIAVPPATHAPSGAPLWILDAASGRMVHRLPLERSPYHACTDGDDVVATSNYAGPSPLWRNLDRDEPEALLMPHAPECLTVCSPAPGVVVTGDVSKLVFFRV